MYRKILRPLLFRISPEKIHHIMVWLLRIAGFIPGGRAIIKAMFNYSDPALEREVFGIKFPNPIGLAAGFDKDARVFNEVAALGFGFVEVGTITPKPQPGNPKPRVFRLPADQAIVNRMGFNNKGVENAVANLRKHYKNVIIGGNLGKNTLTPIENAPADYLKVFRNLYEYVDYFVVNVSCPNVASLTSLQNKDSIRAIVAPLLAFRRGQNAFRPILLKISPDLTREQVDEVIEVMMEMSLDGIVATNTTTSREGLKTPASTINKTGNGGLSGAPLTERSLEIVRYVYRRTDGRFPIIGVGGIMTVEDACRMLDAGASLVQIYTGLIYNGPSFPRQICKHIKYHEAAIKQQDDQTA